MRTKLNSDSVAGILEVLKYNDRRLKNWPKESERI